MDRAADRGRSCPGLVSELTRRPPARRTWDQGQTRERATRTQADRPGTPLRDRKLANWYTSTSPDSSFAHRLVAARALPHGRRVNLRNNRLSIRAADGSAQQYRIDDPRRMPAILREYFGIVLPATAVLRYPSDPA